MVARTANSDANSILAFDEKVVRKQFGKEGPLGNQLVAVKDNICTLEYPTSCGSRMLAGYESPFEATAVKKLKQAGAVVACKTNLDEFGMGSSTEHSAFGRTLHPLDSKRVPGGSSGGSAAVVADGTVKYALGSETGGSVRQPASFCGVVGIKPTYGRVSRRGLVAFASSLDQIGVLAGDVSGAELLLSSIAGHDESDATSAAPVPLNTGNILPDLDGITIGLPREYFPETLPAGIRAACDRSVMLLREAGAVVLDVSLPSTNCAVAAYYIIAPAEASSNLARFDGVRYGNRPEQPFSDVLSMYRSTRGELFGAEVKRRIIIGTYVLSAGYRDAYYLRATEARGTISRDFARVFSGGIDLLFTPTTVSTAFEAGEFISDPLSMYLGDAFVCPANLAGVPAMTVPIGRSGGLPVGGQFIAPSFEEGRMIAVARHLEMRVDPLAEAR